MSTQKRRKAAEAANQNNHVNSNRKTSQSQQILLHLQEGYSITPIDALNMFGCFRLSARIADLRHEGHNIITETVSYNGKQFASYRLEDEK